MNYIKINPTDIANGTGVRVTLFVSGCRNHCEGCFQPETWDFNYGKHYTEHTKTRIIQLLSYNYISGLTLLGGEPFEEENQKELSKLVTEVKTIYSEKTIWVYTGYLIEELVNHKIKYTPYIDNFLLHIDVVVDGKFILNQKDISLEFRGSRNQRIIDVQYYLSNHQIATLF